jgi:NTE family protein
MFMRPAQRRLSSSIGSAYRMGAAAATQGQKAMAFWSRGAGGADSHVPEDLKRQLERFPLTQDIGARALKALVAEVNWFSLPGGMILPREGDNDEAIFLVISGSLGIYTQDETGADHFVAHIPAGETVGEMSLLSGEPHSAAIVALRDTQMLRLSKDAFEELIAAHPRLALNLMRILVRRLRHSTRRSIAAQRARTIAIIPMQPGLPVREFSDLLAHALRDFSLKTDIVGSGAAREHAGWFQALEQHHDLVLYAGDDPDSVWTQMCLRQADKVLLLTRSGETIPSHPFGRESIGRIKRQMPELVILRGPGGLGAHANVPARVMDAYSLHHFLNIDDKREIARLARMLTGRAVGLVLAGGGARGFAHIGILRALREAGVPFDMAGGASMGAIVAACVAMGWPDDEVHARMRRAFLETNPLSDYTLPLVSVFRGQKVSKMLKEHFQDHAIEDMPLPFFCVSSDLTTGRTQTHRSGPVWRSLRASVAIPGLLPPVVEDNRLLVDGGLMNNFPVDIMARYGRGPIVGIDVAGDEAFTHVDGDFEGHSWWHLLRAQMKGAPSIVSILMRSGTVGNEVQRQEARELTDFLLTPPLPGIYLRSWKSFDQAVEAGYAYAAEAIEQDGLNFLWAVKGAG